MVSATDLGYDVSTPREVWARGVTIRFDDAIPSPESASAAYDILDRHHAFDAFLNGLPAVSMWAMREGFRAVGVQDGDVLIFSELMDSASRFLTASADTLGRGGRARSRHSLDPRRRADTLHLYNIRSREGPPMLHTSTRAADAPTMDAAEAVARRWWLPLIAGMLTVTAGVIVLAIEWTAENLALVVGAIFIYRGITRALTPTLSSSARIPNAIAAVASVIVGVAFVVWPSPTLLVLAVFIGAYLVVDGIFHMAGAIELRHDLTTWWLDLVFGAAVTGIGFLALRRPDLTLASLIMFAGLWAIVVGTAEIVAALLMRSAPRELALAAGVPAMGGIEETIVLGGPSLAVDEQLAMLDRLHLSGGVTDTEYERVKARLTGTSVPTL